MTESTTPHSFDLSQNSLENLEKFLVDGGDLTSLSSWPLYLAFKKFPAEKAGAFLSLCSKEQRQCFLDMDCWNKDEIDREGYSYWVEAYSHCSDEKVRSEFIQGTSFSLYLKACFNLKTFDEENPSWPDHDYFFITPDNMILIEYAQDYLFPDKLKSLIEMLYSELGVEKAFSFLFKLMSDSFMDLREEEYERKKYRQEKQGMMDYHNSLQYRSGFLSKKHREDFIKGRWESSDDIHKGHSDSFHMSLFIPYGRGLKDIIQEISKIDGKRQEFLYYDFLKLTSGTLVLENAFKKGSDAIKERGNKTKNRLLLGYEYTKEKYPDKELFLKFSFFDLYKIGFSLIQEGEILVKKSLEKSCFKNISFLGSHMVVHLENSYDNQKEKSKEGSLEFYRKWMDKNNCIHHLIPYGESFYKTLMKMTREKVIQNSFYMNYNVEEIDLESLLMSVFVNFSLNLSSKKKLGVSLDEFKEFYSSFFNPKGEFKSKDDLARLVDDFSRKMGLEKIPFFCDYFMSVLEENLTGYSLLKLKNEDYVHVGGPIIFNTLS